MDKLVDKLVDVISDPVLVAVIVGFAITVSALWKIFGKQHEFIKERLDLLMKENRELREQLTDFKGENLRLQRTSSELASLLAELQKQPLLSEATKLNLEMVAEKTEHLVQFNVQVREIVRDSSRAIMNGLETIDQGSQQSAHIIQSGIEELVHVVEKKERTNEEISTILNQLIRFIEDSEAEKRVRLAEIRSRAQGLLDR